MRLLLDTQIAFWWQTGDRRLKDAVRQLVEVNEDPVLVSRVSLWELAIKAGTGRLKIDLALFTSEVEALGFSWLPIENAHILQLAELPVLSGHKDPFDRLLVAQSASEPLILLTADAGLGRYGALVRVV
ncbi:MAG: PIN domain-containing protein [Anaerolinea sp.]|nr:PIN domain-containing protein [Anaerolinea sp.]